MRDAAASLRARRIQIGDRVTVPRAGAGRVVMLGGVHPTRDLWVLLDAPTEDAEVVTGPFGPNGAVESLWLALFYESQAALEPSGLADAAPPASGTTA